MQHFHCNNPIFLCAKELSHRSKASIWVGMGNKHICKGTINAKWDRQVYIQYTVDLAGVPASFTHWKYLVHSETLRVQPKRPQTVERLKYNQARIKLHTSVSKHLVLLKEMQQSGKYDPFLGGWCWHQILNKVIKVTIVLSISSCYVGSSIWALHTKLRLMM